MVGEPGGRGDARQIGVAGGDPVEGGVDAQPHPQLAAITRRDLHLVEARIDALDSMLNARIDALDRTLNARIDALDSTLNARIDALEASLDAKVEARLGDFRSDMRRTFGTWLFASQAAVIAAVSVLVAIN